MKKFIMYQILVLVFLSIIGCGGEIWEDSNKRTPIELSWYKTKLQINYNNGETDTITVDVWERPNNIYLSKGDLSYWKYIRKGDYVSRKIGIASYVKTYKILSSELKSNIKKEL